MRHLKKKRGMVLLGLMLIGCAAAQQAPDRPQIDADRPYLEFKLTYNYDVYKKPSIFLPKSQPTFAIWLAEKDSGKVQTIYVTGKAAKNEWILAENRPESVPVWYGIQKKERNESSSQIDAITGATPSGETAVIQWQVPHSLLGKQVRLFIEANSSYDYNDHYSDQKGTAGYSGASGQPSLIWRADLDFSTSGAEEFSPEIIGHGHPLGKDHKIYSDLTNVTTARDTFLYVGIRYVEGN
ncbi:MAG: hypothetical protein R3274_07165 [Desulfobacterales bacterium]|nr:hypothetical protein [Desulfobacterales bacterium]